MSDLKGKMRCKDEFVSAINVSELIAVFRKIVRVCVCDSYIRNAFWHRKKRGQGCFKYRNLTER